MGIADVIRQRDSAATASYSFYLARQMADLKKIDSFRNLTHSYEKLQAFASDSRKTVKGPRDSFKVSESKIYDERDAFEITILLLHTLMRSSFAGYK